ncbi:transporter substrate-binding domain-containing protein [Chelatococcus asaccharovorans]|nr:transporter substrate-binding domain-containing protein [Chelatococcus asaccharovorans]
MFTHNQGERRLHMEFSILIRSMSRLRGMWRPLSLAAFCLAVANGQVQAETSRLDDVLKRDKLIVVGSSTTPPAGFVNEKGEHTGFEIEFARLIAKYLLGSADKIEFIITSADGRFPAVLSGKADFGISTATIYPDRAVRLAFTRPYMDAGTAVVVPEDSPIKEIADLNSPDVNLASSNSAAAVDRAKRFNAKGNPLFFDTDAAAFLALETGRAQAYQGDIAVAKWRAANSKKKFRLLPGLLGNRNGNAIYMKPGDFRMWLTLDTIVQELVTGSKYDEYRDLYRKWFDSDPPPQRFYN